MKRTLAARCHARAASSRRLDDGNHGALRIGQPYGATELLCGQKYKLLIAKTLFMTRAGSRWTDLFLRRTRMTAIVCRILSVVDSMVDFFEQPILNSPYERPSEHWELDDGRRPTNKRIRSRRPASFIVPVPKPRKQRRQQAEIVYDQTGAEVSNNSQRYDLDAHINGLRRQLDAWRELPAHQWRVTPQTARLLEHWRHHSFKGIRPFFCQIEAAETVIWLTEVAPSLGREAGNILKHLQSANESANPGLSRLALKLATGAGKTTVMAMLIAWQTVNAVRHPGSRRFTRGFLVVTPGITIRERLRVLKPNDPDSYYQARELVPHDMLPDLRRATIVITNYHAFMRRERLKLAGDSRTLLQGHGPALQTLETQGQMLRRVMPELMGMKRILAFNDEGHHCYRERPAQAAEEGDLKGEERDEAKRNQEAARVWISGLEAVHAKLGLSRVIDLSATPFFLRGSGYAEGTLFPWTTCDFSLLDAIECGIVKLPRVPVADNVASAEMPVYRNLWEHISQAMPRKGRRANAGLLDPSALPMELQSALDALYGHYERIFSEWQDAKIDVPPCFIVVCNNTATSKLVYDYVAGFRRRREDGSEILVQGSLKLFHNFDETGAAYPRPRTLLIDSEQLESGAALDANFRQFAKDEIERFRREVVERTGQGRRAEEFKDEELLREAMNTVGKAGRLGTETRCVVSVSMLTEGWDANTVTHVLGVRAFGTQLLCEQVVGRALRRQSYELNEDDRFNVEYADVLGIPFDFTAKPTIVKPQPPRNTVQVYAVSPDRDACAIRFPRVAGYRVELPEERLTATFDDDSTLVLTPDRVGPAETENEGILGESILLTLAHTASTRLATVAYHLAKHLVETKWQDADGTPKLHLFGQLKCIALQWLDNHLVCRGGTYPAQLLYKQLGEEAGERITRAIVRKNIGSRPATVVLDPYNPHGSTADVHFATSKETYRTDPRRCHVNHVVCDSGWEAEFARIIEAHPKVCAYVKNQGLGFTVPYCLGGQAHAYVPDFIVLADDDRGEDDLLHLVVEVKGRRLEDAKAKKETMETQWVPGVNRLGEYGRWQFVECRDVYGLREEIDAALVGIPS